MTNSENGRSPKRGIYLLPNLFTTAGLFAGFYSIVASMQHMFELACITIFIAMIADGLDGRVARLTNTQSPFGAEYDSLSDMIAFGLAPALLIYNWSLMGLGKFGWLCAFFYVASTALRLARFNTQLESADPRFFSGLSSPAAAGVMAGFVWVMQEYGVTDGGSLSFLMATITVACAALMVSNVDYYSFKVFDFRSHVSFKVLVVVVLAVMAIAVDPAQVLFYSFALYMVLGPVLARMSLKRDVDEAELDEAPSVDEEGEASDGKTFVASGFMNQMAADDVSDTTEDDSPAEEERHDDKGTPLFQASLVDEEEMPLQFKHISLDKLHED